MDVLGVSQIVVCGHSTCGAMAATLDSTGLDELPHVVRWLDIGGARVLADSLPAQVDANAEAQLERLRAHPCVSKALAEGRLTLQAWTYEIPTGAVRHLAEVTS